MRRLFLWLACAAALCGAGGALGAVALADGTTTSAGDQQYVDPLTTSTSAHRTKTTPATVSTTTTASSTTPAPTSTSPSLSQTPPGGVPSNSSSSSTTATAASSSSASSHRLPYTGLNVGACLALGLALMGGGLGLRRLALRRTAFLSP